MSSPDDVSPAAPGGFPGGPQHPVVTFVCDVCGDSPRAGKFSFWTGLAPATPADAAGPRPEVSVEANPPASASGETFSIVDVGDRIFGDRFVFSVARTVPNPATGEYADDDPPAGLQHQRIGGPPFAGPGRWPTEDPWGFDVPNPNAVPPKP